jgi:hypothetical protein
MKFYMTELCREIYWNIGHGAKVLVPMFLVTLPALALVVGAIIERRKIYLQGRPLQRLDRLSDRIDILFRNVMLQCGAVGPAPPMVFSSGDSSCCAPAGSISSESTW